VISSGYYEASKLVLLKYSFDDCTFSEVFQDRLKDDEYFGEGLSLSNENKIYMLTYKNEKVLVWDLNKDEYKASLVEEKKMPDDNQLRQGWGLAYKFDKQI